jgi:predicted XRE-type DNA-binding protein
MADKTYKNVSEMVRDLPGDRDLVDAVDEALGRQRILRQLMVMRTTRDMSQSDVGEVMGCSQSRISKMESSADDELKYGELRRYADAVGCQFVSGIRPRRMTPAEEVKSLAGAVQNRLLRMVELAQCDEDVAQGVARFLAEAFLNVSLIVGRTAASLPKRADGTPLCEFRVEIAPVERKPDRAEEDCAEIEETQCSELVAS